MASGWTNKGRADSHTNPWATSDMRMLYVDTPPANQAALDDLNFVSDIVADEIAVGGYSRMTLAGESVAEDDTGNRAVLDATDPTGQTLAAGTTIVGAYVFRQVTNDADSPIWCYLESNDVITNGGLVNPAFDVNGVSTVE